MPHGLQLPGAEGFSKYLEEMVEGVLTAEGPEIVDSSYNGEFGKRWIVKQGDNKIGEYHTFGPKPDEADFGREFRGRIPGYRNECAAVSNHGKPESEKMPEDSVGLIYDNKRFEERSIREGPGKIIDTPWQRQDGHEDIPFP